MQYINDFLEELRENGSVLVNDFYEVIIEEDSENINEVEIRWWNIYDHHEAWIDNYVEWYTEMYGED